ncbi:MAG TPA: hypothetical protein VK421_12730 [Pyrinomonadaceae bacterium]|nr:hypothetical protein [Pyrinomonadaceae bacterium]
MRPEFDSEIDSVLRGHARRGGATPAARAAGLRALLSNEVAAASHLDADEIAAFGEGALPAAARARYAAHLADCDDCRRSVTEVALAAGAADRVEERERVGVAAAAATQSPSWRERLAAFFAPRAWRYAMPVVALVAVSAVVLVVTRRLPREGAMETVSRRDNAAQQANAPAVPEAHHAEAAPAQTQPGDQAGTLAGRSATTGGAPATGGDAETAAVDEVAKLKPKSVDGVDQSALGGAAGTAGAQPEVAREVQAAPPPAAQGYAIAPQGTPAPVPPPAPAVASRPMVLRDIAQATPTPAPVETVEVARDDDSRPARPRDEPTATKRHGPQRGVGGRAAELSAADAAKDNRASRRPRGPQNNAAQSNAARNSASEASRSESDEAKARQEREQQSETRSAGGRRFRREGNVWIDTAYRAGQATVVVRRDSEQYRALVADEPEIGRISRALGGEAVIVWKGRAYRVKP